MFRQAEETEGCKGKQMNLTCKGEVMNMKPLWVGKKECYQETYGTSTPNSTSTKEEKIKKYKEDESV